MRTTNARWIAAAAVALGFVATASAGENWMVRTRLIDVAPNSSGSDVLEKVDVGDDFTAEVDFTRYINARFALELIVATAAQELKLDGTSVGSVNHLPPTLVAQWHFKPSDKFNPYVGLGLNATFFYGKSGLIDSLKLSTSFGPAAQLGADWKITERTYLNFDVKYIGIKTDVKSEGNKIGEVKINPLVIGFGVGWKF
ncbi:MAG: OmpW family outer membrane protein [Acidobacteriota bacterium]